MSHLGSGNADSTTAPTRAFPASWYLTAMLILRRCAWQPAVIAAYIATIHEK